MNWPSTRWGRPALGRIARPAGPIPESASRQPTGPAPQLTPMTSISATPRSAAAAAAGAVPSASPRSSPKVRRAAIGRSAAAARASSTAMARWSISANVSNQKRSAPPSSNPSTVSRKVLRMTRSSRFRISRVGAPSGPMDPATSTSRPVTSRASRAICAPRRANRPARSPKPYGASRMRFAPKVEVSMRSAPAARYSRWMAPISSGRVSTSSSSTARCGIPRENSNVPIAPSASNGPAVSRSRKRSRAPTYDSSARFGASQRSASATGTPLRRA